MTCKEQKNRKYIEKKLNPISDANKIEEILNYCNYLYEKENQRKTTIEGKANTLIAATGIATAFIVGFFGLIVKAGSNINTFLLIIINVIYLLIVFFLLLCVYNALKSVKVDKYKYALPDPEDIYKLKDSSLDEVKKERAIDYLFSYFKNRDLNNDKATSLSKAQEKLKISIILLAFLPLLFCMNIYLSSKQNDSSKSQTISTDVKKQIGSPTLKPR